VINTIIEERVTNHTFAYETKSKILTVDGFSDESSFDMDVNGIKILMNMFKFLNDNKLL
jgi:hypothetical protein